MCIAIYIPKNKNISNTIIENCFANNPDGAGIMWQQGGKVHIRKGFFSVEQLIEAFRKVPQNLNRGLHCRIATSGKISTTCCHPFPITGKIKDMGFAEQEVDGAVIHNGVISFCTPNEGLNAPYSDTMLFTKDYLNKLGDLVFGNAFKKLFEEASTSKLLIFKKDKVAMIGKWIEDNGVFYSNNGYKSNWKRYWSKSADSYGGYEYYGYSDYSNYGKLGSYYAPNAKLSKAEDSSEFGYEITFYGVKQVGKDPQDEMDKILNELERTGCYPDSFTAYETFSEMENTFSFDVTVLHLPRGKVAGHTWYIFDETINDYVQG